MALERKFFDDFDNATVDLQTDLVNASVAEAGTELTLSIAEGQHANPDNPSEDVPIVFDDLDTYLDGHRGLVCIETRFSAFARTGVEGLSYLALFRDRDDYLGIGWYDSNNWLYIQGKDAGSYITRWNSSGVADPNVTPHRYRIWLNLTNEKVVAERDDGYEFELAALRVAFQYSVDDGSTWTVAYSEELKFGTQKFGFYLRNWANNWRGMDASYDYLEVLQDIEPQVVVSPPDVDASVGTPAQKGLIENRAHPIDIGGPPSHQTGVGQGQRIPGPVNQPVGSVGPFDKGLLEDRLEIVDAGGPQSLYPGQPSMGLFFEVSRGLLENRVRYKIDPTATYQDDKIDGDGNETLYASSIIDVIRFNTTGGGFGDPTANNHWGYAKDGKAYADGVECGIGDFGTLAGGVRRTVWNGSLAEPFKTNDPVPGTIAMTADDEVEYAATGMNSWAGGPNMNTLKKWYIDTGDFDLEVSFNSLVGSGTNREIAFGIQYEAVSDNTVYLSRRDGSYLAARHTNGAWASLGTGGGDDASGKMRITRVAGVYSLWRDSSGWVQVGSSYAHPSGDAPVSLWLSMNGNGGGNMTVRLSALTLNSGSTTNRAAWYREATGSHRGTQPDMPANLAAVVTLNSVDLIDTTNDKLWMRFIKATNNLIHANSGSIPRRLRWADGVLFLANGTDPTATQEGNGTPIDFTRDAARNYRESASTVEGSYYGTNIRVGAIRFRNSALGMGGTNTAFGIPDYRVYAADLFMDSGFEYHAIATQAGLKVTKWERWYDQNAPTIISSESSETTVMIETRINPIDGDLFWADATSIYQVNRLGGGGWETVMDGGTFTSLNTKAWPGTPTQRRLVLYGAGVVFVQAVEGVYQVNWPAGSFELFYGRPGSGATHEVLPSFEAVLSIALGNDGVNDLLIVGGRSAAWEGGMLAAVKLSDNTLYGITPIQHLKEPGIVAA